MGGAPPKRGSAAEKKAATLIWIGTAVFLIGVFAYTISDLRTPVSARTGDAVQTTGSTTAPTAPR
jgi:hypothetical protein